MPSFAEFELMLNTYKFHIFAIFENWLRDNEHVINYAQLPVYNLEISKNNTGQRGGGVDVYTKAKITYKRSKISYL